MLQLIQYGLVGATANIAAYVLYLYITYLGVEHKVTATLVFMLGALFGFIGNRSWTFNYRGQHGRPVYRFFVSYAAAYSLNLSCLWVAVDQLGAPHQVVQGVNVILISILLFLAQKYWIFSSDSNP